MKQTVLFFGASLLCAAMAATSVAQTNSQLSPTGRTVVQASDSITIKATVEDIDPATRTVTLKGEGGKTVSVKCGDEVRNFDQIKKGDQVTAKYYQSVALGLRKPGEPPSAEEQSALMRAEPGQKPGGVAIKTVQLSATIESIDKATREVTLKGPEGKTKTVKAGDAVKNFDSLKVGDQVVATMTEALAIGVMKPTQ
jgi:hypothetical protein